ncbi:MAG TPA: acid-shock protein [Mesorhizobium sp.]|nr:acid-shock protein [Mesorhizobium sp.]
MTTLTKAALAFLALAGTAGTMAVASDDDFGDWRGGKSRLERADADDSGDVTFEEFTAAMKRRIGGADADGDGKMTVAEIALEIERMRVERMARRIVERFDTDGDGALTPAEIESRQKKMFALLDRNDDGKIVKEEMPRRRHDRRSGDWDQ